MSKINTVSDSVKAVQWAEYQQFMVQIFMEMWILSLQVVFSLCHEQMSAPNKIFSKSQCGKHIMNTLKHIKQPKMLFTISMKRFRRNRLRMRVDRGKLSS